MKERFSAGAAVTCDYPRCAARFATASDASVVRDQAAASGWQYVSGKQIRDEKNMAISSKKVDVCPTHRPRGMVMR